MATNRETGKDRWKRVPKDYFKKADGLQRTKLKFSALALFLVLACCALGMDWSWIRTGKSGEFTPGLDLWANHGTLAQVHSAWDHNCKACHVPFEPIDGRPWLATSSTAAYRTSDQQCMSCHAGPAHHAATRESEVRSCAECHRDHRGREASLVKLDDVECTRCHSSLKDHLNKDAKTEFENKITRFDLEHPPFRPEAATPAADNKPMQDRGGLKFNHALHMTPGMIKKPGDTPYTVEKIPVESERMRYGKSKEEAVKLDCTSCHVLEASDLKTKRDPSIAASARPVRSDGKYYQPVNFETQCRACHDLTFDPQSPTIRAPHGVQPEVVVAFLKKTYAAQLLADKPDLLEKKFVPTAEPPGKWPIESSVREAFDDAVGKAEQVLFGDSKQSCLECHELVKKEGSLVPEKVAATNVPTVWFTHASFDHTAHRGVSCRDCHAQTYAIETDGVKRVEHASTLGTDVNLPGIENCRKCHAPAGRAGGWLPWSSSTSTGGVAHNCTECHTYHDGDHALAGVGAAAEDATSPRQIEQFLLGKGEPQAPSKVGKTAKP
jgi:nitrate/TMAO reductase-like tetraheme cytochrome c subunit